MKLFNLRNLRICGKAPEAQESKLELHGTTRDFGYFRNEFFRRMINLDNCSIAKCIVHKVGNKLRDEKLELSRTQLVITEEMEKVLHLYFLKYFKQNNELHQFHHDIELSMNEVYNCAEKLFEGGQFNGAANNIARHLYEQARNASIKSGELFVALFEDIEINQTTCSGIGIFKSERKDEYLRLDEADHEIEIAVETGINPGKLDKGCLILNTGDEEGFTVLTYEQNSAETDYWRKEFLSIRPRNDSYQQTKNYLSLCREFVQDKLDSEFNVTKADKIDLLNRSVEYFKEKEDFKAKEFAEEVFEDPDVIKSFKKFQREYVSENEGEFEDNFEISHQAVKKQARIFKSVLKLDKNFHIYIHGDRNLIEQGTEKDGRKFYKIYFEKEQ